ncbi:MAG: ribosomal protein S18-alanine N-acetyltransferase [Oscillospiraceae bacterium]|nr:ribosomal protein S18-alanine N-acetyltransferase [Oscillospiraceae bacterium]
MMPSEIRVRPLREADLPAVLVIEARCFPDPWSEGVFRSALEQENALWLGAELEGQLIGYAGMQSVLDEGYIDNVAVDPAFRRRGAASALLRAFDREAERLRLLFLSLEVRAGNKGAIVLYASHGFREVGLRRGYYLRPPEDALIMTKYYTEDTEP